MSSRSYHVSSAVILVRPDASESTVTEISRVRGVEVHAVQDGKVIIVIEGNTSGELGASLSEISGIEGVVAANMVFEHTEDEEALRNDRRTDAA